MFIHLLDLMNVVIIAAATEASVLRNLSAYGVLQLTHPHLATRMMIAVLDVALKGIAKPKTHVHHVLTLTWVTTAAKILSAAQDAATKVSVMITEIVLITTLSHLSYGSFSLCIF